MKRRLLDFTIIFLALGIVMLPADILAAPKRLTISPTRIVVDSRERSGELTIMNVFSEAATYRVQIINNKMTPEGGYETLSAPLDSAFNAEEFVRLTPRQFRLEPQASQRIRLSVRRPPDLPPGDYRFHVMVIRLSNMETNQPEENQRGMNLAIATNLGITIPVVVRQGEYNGDVKIEDMQIVTPAGKPSKAVLTVRHLGNSDIFGGVKIFWEPQGGQREQIGNATNTNVFHETETRKIDVSLSKVPQGPGKLIVQYVEDYYKQGVIDELILDR